MIPFHPPLPSSLCSFCIGNGPLSQPAMGCLLNIGCSQSCRPAITSAGALDAAVGVLKSSEATKTAKSWASAVCQKVGNGDKEKQWQKLVEAGA